MISFFKRLFRISNAQGSDREYFKDLIQTRNNVLMQESAMALRDEKCGNVVTFQQEADGERVFYGKFFFKRDDVAAILREKLLLVPNLKRTDEGAIYKWISDFDETKFEPVPIPLVWSRFIYVADELIRAGESDVVCMECRQKFSTGRLIPRDDKGLPNWNFNRLQCPNGHQLLEVAMLHILKH